jgi:RNA polymerase sigma-70 factor (ECF subfamily)
MDNVSPPSGATRDLGAIFEEHFDYVWATLRRLGVRDADREDLVHEVFLKVHARLGDYDGTRPLRPWLFGFAYRVAADHRRLARHRVEVLGDAGEVAADNEAAEERIAATEERDLLIAALGTLDLERRAMIVMHDLDEVPVPEIARHLGIPVNTAYSRLRLAREQISSASARLRNSRGSR